MSITAELEKRGKGCIGCFVCENVCSNGAIKMILDGEGYYRATSDASLCKSCNRCLEVCPQITLPLVGTGSPDCYAVKVISGMLIENSVESPVSMFAKWMLSRGGHVCATVLDDNSDFVYLLSNDEDIVKSMGNFKCICREMRGIYGIIDEKLKAGEYVLFVGCPCHVAALRNYVGENDHLYALDLSCGGQPSKTAYRDYLLESFGSLAMTDLLFDNGGLFGGLLVAKSADDKVMVSPNDIYITAYERRLITDVNCSDCQFASVPRQGDLTVGCLRDEGRLVRYEDSRGDLDVVMVNTSKGEEMFTGVRDELAYFRPVSFDYLKTLDWMSSSHPLNESRPRFHNMTNRGISFVRSADYSLFKRYDVGITGFWRNNDYGGELSYYALYSLFRDMGKEVLMIEYRNNIEGYPSNPTFLNTMYPSDSLLRWCSTLEDQQEAVSQVYNLITGPGPIWDRRLLDQNSIGCYSLDFAPIWRNKISVSSTFGSPVRRNDEDHLKLMERIGKIDRVSVSDLNSRDVCKEMGIEAEIMLDPIFLCNDTVFDELIKTSRADYPNWFVLSYAIRPNSLHGAEKIYDALGFGAINVCSSMTDPNKYDGYPITDVYSVENWVKAIKKSSFVLTDSYHALVLAILFRKPFLFIMKKDASHGDRVATLLSMLGLEGRHFESVDEAIEANVVNSDIDYDGVWDILDSKRKDSIKWIMESLV